MSKINNQQYFQYNYIKVIENYVPQVYFEDEVLAYDSEKDIIYDLMHKVALLAVDMGQYVFSVSGKTPTQLATYFLESNKLTKVTPHNVQEKLFNVLSNQLEAAGYPTKIADFEDVTSFTSALNDVILPNVSANNPSATYISEVSSHYTTVTDASSAHYFLIDSFGFLYFLNRDESVAGFEPYEGVIELLTENTFYGKDISLKDCIKKFYKFLWHNSDTELRFNAYIPERVNKSTSGYDELGTSSWTSGTQQNEKLNTLIDIVFNEKDAHSVYLKDSITTLLDGGFINDVQETKGPLIKLLKAYGCSLYDIKTIMDDLGDLLDIDACPKEFFEHLAHYIGWNLRGNNISEWRNQLRQAIFVYKSKGTKNALVGAMHSLFPSSIFHPITDLEESWESYIPFLLYYVLKTESPVFNTGVATDARRTSFEFFRKAFDSLGFTYNMPNGIDTILRTGVDYLIGRMQKETKSLIYGGKPWELKLLHDLGRDTIVPPFERDNYYRFQNITQAQLDSFRKWLMMPTCDGGFEVPVSAVNALENYIVSSTFTKSDKLGLGNKWKFFTAASQIPFNRDILIRAGKADSLDYWNSKSSHVFLTLEIDDYMYRTNVHPWGQEATDLIGDTLRDFVPFIVVMNLRFIKAYSDPNEFSGIDCRAFELRPKNNPDVNQATLEDSYAGGFKLASGLGFVLNTSAGHPIDYKIIGESRDHQYLPPPSSVLWRDTSDATPSGALIPDADHIRNTVRRKNLLNMLPVEDLHFRDGKAQPMSMQFMSASGILAAHSSIMNTPEYHPKGFDYSKNKLVEVIQHAQAYNGFVTIPEQNPVWDASVGIIASATFYEVSTTDMFPIRDTVELCSSGIRSRNLMNPGWFELWKINDAITPSSTNIIKDSVFTSGVRDSVDWFVTEQGQAEVDTKLIQDIRCARIKSKHWITESSGTTYPEVAGITQTLSDLKPYTEYKVEFTTLAHAPDNKNHYNNGVGVMLKQDLNTSSPVHWNFQAASSTWSAYNSASDKSVFKFAPNWGSRLSEERVETHSFTFTTPSLTRDIVLEFWGMGSLKATLINTSATDEYSGLSDSITSVNYVANVKVLEVIEEKPLLENLDIGEAPHRWWHLYNRFKKQISSKLFDGGVDLDSYITEPLIRGGNIISTWDTSTTGLLDTSQLLGQEPILGENLLTYGELADASVSSGVSLPDGWFGPAHAGGKIWQLHPNTVNLDGKDYYKLMYGNASGNAIDDVFTSGTADLQTTQTKLSFYWESPAVGIAASGGAPTVRLHNKTKNVDWSFENDEWRPILNNPVTNNQYWRPYTSPNTTPTFKMDKWSLFETQIKSNPNFSKDDEYQLFFAPDLSGAAASGTASIANVSLQPIVGWRTPQLFDNGYFDVYGDRREQDIFINNNSSISMDDYEISSGNSITFVNDGGVKKLDYVKKLNNEHYFKDSNHINVFDGSSVSGWELPTWATSGAFFTSAVQFSGSGVHSVSGDDDDPLMDIRKTFTHWSHGTLRLFSSFASYATSPVFNLRPKSKVNLNAWIMKSHEGGASLPNSQTAFGALYNKTLDKYLGFDGNWYTTISATDTNGTSWVSLSTKGGTSEHNFRTWEQIPRLYTLPDDFSENDDWQVVIFGSKVAESNANRVKINCFIGPITITDETNNTLEPDMDYNIKVSARTNSLNGDTLGVAIRTLPIDNVIWYCDFRRQKWVARRPNDKDIPYREMTRKYTKTFEESDMYFNTYNGRREIPTFDRTWEDRNGEVHHIDQKYEVVVFRLTPISSENVDSVIQGDDTYVNETCYRENNFYNVITVEKIRIINVDYQNLSNSVSSLDSLGNIYEHIFDVYGHDILTRDNTKYSLGKNGGTRSLYIDEYGFDYDHAATQYGGHDASGTELTLKGDKSNDYLFTED
tara:strand:+ start:2922 stop:8594 length:5673 start_codon:yes stop_codon:yes gene_type:complete